MSFQRIIWIEFFKIFNYLGEESENSRAFSQNLIIVNKERYCPFWIYRKNFRTFLLIFWQIKVYVFILKSFFFSNIHKTFKSSWRGAMKRPEQLVLIYWLLNLFLIEILFLKLVHAIILIQNLVFLNCLIFLQYNVSIIL
jgi:hypothetical protein